MCCSGWWLDVLQWVVAGCAAVGGGWMYCSGWWQCVLMFFKIGSCYLSTSIVEEAKPKGRKSRATGDIYSDGEGEERVAVEGEPSKKKRRRLVIKSVLLTSKRLSC